jgi:hypothetical protein
MTAQTALVAAALLGLLALRIWLAFTLRVNSDEPQHLHTVWCWTQGILPYRDVFDNHAPLFHVLYAPLLAMLGERADIVPLMRLAVIPWYALTLWFVYLLGSKLYDRRIGWIAVGLTALYPTFFTRSVEFRPDDAWAAAWIGALVVAVSGRPTRKRALQCGMVAGLAAAFSIKSAILITAALVAAAMVMVILALQHRMPNWRATLSVAVATAIGGAILPVTILIAFVAAGAWEAMRYCLFVHNVAQGLGRWEHSGWHTLAFPLLLPALAVLMQHMLRERGDPLLPALRAWIWGAGLSYLALRASYQPLLDKQDLLPLVPMLAPAAAALLVHLSRGQWRGRIAIALALSLEAAVLLHADRPWRREAHQFTDELGTLLRLSRPTEYVMDDKAESIFRPRPFYWVLENVTQHHLARGLIADDIPQRLVDDRVAIGVFDRERGADRDFVQNNYVAVAPHVEVAGMLLGAGRVGEAINFDVALPNRYALVARDGQPEGRLDGLPYTKPRDLSSGPHSFVPAHAGAWAVVWDRALALGYSPFSARGYGDAAIR